MFIGRAWPLTVIVPVTAASEKSSAMSAGPCLTVRFLSRSDPFSMIAESVAAPIGVSAVSTNTQAPFSSRASWVIFMAMLCAPRAIVAE